MTDISDRHLSMAASSRTEADSRFLRRILFGLIAATIFSGAVSLVLTSQYELIESMQVASTHGPA